MLVYAGMCFFQSIYRVYTGISEKNITSCDGIGISRYMMVYDRHMSAYDENSALILVMVTNVLGRRPLISGTCLLILPRAGLPYRTAHPVLRLLPTKLAE